jgi:hypothetical protein
MPVECRAILLTCGCRDPNKCLIDALLQPEAVAAVGIKYSCFDRTKNKDPD